MRTLIGCLMVGFAVMLGLMEIAALADPAGTGLANDADPYAPPAPWYEHAFWIAAVLALGWGGVRLLSRGIVGRLVRGRGFTPEPRRP